MMLTTERFTAPRITLVSFIRDPSGRESWTKKCSISSATLSSLIPMVILFCVSEGWKVMDPDVTVKSISPIVQTVNTRWKQNEREAAYNIVDAHRIVDLKCLHMLYKCSYYRQPQSCIYQKLYIGKNTHIPVLDVKQQNTLRNNDKTELKKSTRKNLAVGSRQSFLHSLSSTPLCRSQNGLVCKYL